MTRSPPRRFSLDRLAVANLRNLEPQSIELVSGMNVLTGANGQGKTSVLEAIYVLATSRSFRTARLTDAMQHGAARASIRGTFTEHWQASPITREQSVGIEASKRRYRVDGERPTSLGAYAVHSPVVVFDAQQLALSTGPAALRRTLLDRVALFTSPASAEHRLRYGRALRERQRLLGERLKGRTVDAELDAYEQVLAEHGVRLTEARAEAARVIAEGLYATFEQIAASDLRLDVSYQPGGGVDVAEATQRLHAQRNTDARRRRAGYGPHRDELCIELNRHPARVVGSQGQHRTVTLALKLAELEGIARARGLQPIFLLDDVSSELDPERLAALFSHLATTRCQLILTTTRPDLISTPAESVFARRDFVVRAGTITAVQP